jgi:hypothetical protein
MKGKKGDGGGSAVFRCSRGIPSFTSLHYTSLHLLHFTTLHFISLHFTSLHFTSLHFTSLHFTSLHLLPFPVPVPVPVLPSLHLIRNRRTAENSSFCHLDRCETVQTCPSLL